MVGQSQVKRGSATEGRREALQRAGEDQSQMRDVVGEDCPEASAVIGYASCPSGGLDASDELKHQADMIASECERLGLDLIELVGEREPTTGKGLARPGITYALDRIHCGFACGLVVAELSRITHSAAEIGTVIALLERSSARLIAADHGFDTEREDGRLAAAMLIDVSRWERLRLSERTRRGLQAARSSGRATGRGAVADDPLLRGRILQMRASGMTLQAIADRFNEEGVPTVRGGAKWRHSSVQAAAGYRRSSSLGLGDPQLQS